jgi:hypothetical protein
MGNRLNGGANGASFDAVNAAQNAITSLSGKKSYDTKVDGGTDGAANQPIRIVATESLFNPFNVFRYSKFAKATAGPGGGTGNPGNIDLDPYQLKYERAGDITDNVEGLLKGKTPGVLRQEAKDFHNPSAVKLVQWANEQAKDSKNSAGPIYPYPYSITDFLWCKYYGKIPNNRLITLRRYPVPVEDNLMISKENLPLVPIAQAVTWFGADTGNKLSEVLALSWGLSWENKTATVQDVEGNEVKVEQLLDAAGIPAESTALRQALIATLGDAQNIGMAANGMDLKAQEYDKASYGDNGPYWNRVLGPVNVIDSTQIRKRGLEFGGEGKGISIDFEYNLRTWSGANPKMAFLDLLANFLSLTYNSAPFWGGGMRYFQQTGFLAPGFNTDNLEKGNNVQGMIDVMSGTGAQFLGAAKDLKSWVDNIQTQLTGAGGDVDAITNVLKTSAENSKLGQIFAGSRLSGVTQKPLLMRSLLDGRAVGEWHMMIGNPMEPLAVIGNLCLDSCSLTFGDELGEDGFPTSMKFTVTLKHGRPRAKQDIESMFNLGGGPLTSSMLAQPSSASNTLGENNSIRMSSYYGLPINTQEISKAADTGTASPSQTTSTDKTDYSTSALKDRDTASTNLSNYFKPSVERAYGANFANSNILPSYFFNRVTKD